MDNRQAFGVAHHFDILWKHCGFLISTGKLIAHHLLIKNLLNAILLSKLIAICKCEAHPKSSNSFSLGNADDDAPAKHTAILEVLLIPFYAIYGVIRNTDINSNSAVLFEACLICTKFTVRKELYFCLH